MKKTSKLARPNALGGLAAFSQKTAAAVIDPPANKRSRGQGEHVAITVRLPKDAWMRLQMFAMSEGLSLQSLAVASFNRELAAKGLPLLNV
jgi:hypothetical protein